MEENISKIIRDDLILFKNETLKDIKEQEKILLEKYRNIEFTIMEKIENFDQKFLKLTNKIIEITAFIENLKDVKNSINLLLNHKTKTENSLIDLNIKLRSSNKDSQHSINDIYCILKDSIIYPGIIGTNTKFKTFHDFIDYILAHIAYAKQFIDKISKEVNNNKSNQDKFNENIKNQIELMIERTSRSITNEILLSEEKTQSTFKKHEDKMQNFKAETTNNFFNFKNDLDKLDNNFKEELNQKNKELNSKLKEINEKNNQYNNEVKSLKDQYLNLNKCVKEINHKIENGYSFLINNEKDSNERNKNKANEKKLIYRNFSANNNNNQNKRIIRLMRNERGNIYDNKDNISNEQMQNIKTKKNTMTMDSYNSYNSESSKDEYRNNNTFWRKSQSHNRFYLFDQDVNKKYGNINRNNNFYFNNENSSNYHNSFSNINIMRNRNNNKDNNLGDKSNYINLLSNKKYINAKQLKNISLNSEGNKEDFCNPELINNNNNKKPIQNTANNLNNKNNDNSLNILNNNKNNDKYYINIIDKNHKNILNSKNSDKNLKKNNSSKYPKIITNNGERIIVSSHPVYHRDKFTNNINPNFLFAYKNSRFYNNEKNNKMKSNNNIINTNNKLNSSEKYFDNNNIKSQNKNNENTVDNENSYNNNSIFKTLLLNPKNTNKDKKKFINKGRNNSNKNKDYLVLTYNDNNNKKI